MKNDEFYTQLTDIEKECKHYRDYFKDKVIYCNCDDARESNFFKYFAMNFEFLGLKKLITTSYNENGHGTKLIYEGDKNGNHYADDEEIIVEELKGNGSFDSEECIEILKQVDIVVTNPPFSLFREYVTQLMKYDKKFLIIGNMNAITYKEILPLIKEGKLWLGVSLNGIKCSFDVPSWYDGKNTFYVDGKKKFAINNACWFTNMKNPRRNETLDLYKKYYGHEKDYPKYDNYDAINVDKVSDIPCDYDGVMGVPITFLFKYNPDQFEIVEFRKGEDGKDLVYSKPCDAERKREKERVQPYFRILICQRQLQG